MPRSLAPYMRILEDLLDGRIDAVEFRTRTIRQYDKIDAGVDWARDWGPDVAAVLDQMDGDAEVYYPDATEESYISLDELLRSSHANLKLLREAEQRQGGPCE